MNALLDSLKTLGLDLKIEWNTATPIRNGSQWFIGKEFMLDEVVHQLAWFGDYKTGQKGEWKSGSEQLGKESQKKVNEQIEAALAMERGAREKVWEERAGEVEKEFGDFSSMGTTPYLTRKGISDLFGARICPNEHGDPIVVVPLRDTSGKLWNYQRIYAQKLSKGDKFMEQACRIEACFHILHTNAEPSTLPKADSTEPIYICEGFATAASVKMAFGTGPHTVVAAINSGNLQSVGTAIKEACPKAKLVFCADNDAFTIIDGKQVNVGLLKARRSAGAVGGELVWPVFRVAQKSCTDFNDLHLAEGIDRVKDQILNHAKYVTGIQPMVLRSTKTGKTIEPSEKEVTDYLLKYFSEKIVRFDKSLFLYNGTHWVELDAMGVDKMKQWIGVAAQHTLGARDINNFYLYLFMHCPQVPGGVSLYQPNPYCANFQNGTLHAHKGGKLEFRKHDPTDYLTATLPFDYPGDDAEPFCPKFDAMIKRQWADCLDIAQISDFLDELIGSCLMPAWAVMAFFKGKSNSGKSTIIKLLVRLLSQENVCSVQPCEMFGFNMETMVGKLVNFDTDIDINRPINDSEIKKIVDRVPRRIRRKGRADVYGYLPAVHLFAANDLPKSLDGRSHAYGRRFVIIQTDKVLSSQQVVKDFEAKILEEEMPGILARGLRGVRRLLKTEGTFTVPESSYKHVAEMEADSDVVGQFLEEVKHGEVFDKSTKLVISPDARVERKQLWEIYSAWQDESIVQIGSRLGKKQFYERIESVGYCATQSKGVRRFVGLGVVTTDSSIA